MQTTTTTTSFSVPISIFLFYLTLTSVGQAAVPPSKTFTYVNEGEYGEFTVEYEAYYRGTGIFQDPFALCFYNTTPNAFTLGLRMGSHRGENVMKLVWDANRGNPVQEGAKLIFGRNGNLVLADVDGRIAWQTGTTNKGVVGLSLLPNGNLVLYDKNNKFIWQSFDYPSDTLLVGQSFRQGGPNALVSRVSAKDGSNGPYSLVLEKNTLALYFKSKNSPKPILYYRYEDFGPQKGTLSSVTFQSQPENSDSAYASELYYGLLVGNETGGTRLVGRPKYNSTFSMLRVESDGSLKTYTYYDKVDFRKWDITYSLFDKDGDYGVSECQLPTRCGSLGICEDSQCVACPRPEGSLGWSKTCAPPSLPACGGRKNLNASYYKVIGVDHFMDVYNQGEGPMKVSLCREKCDKDCGCLGFFYKEKSSRCLLAPVLGTLTKVSDPSHVAYIKTK